MSFGNGPDQGESLWSTMTLEMKTRVWVTGAALLVLGLFAVLPDQTLPDALIAFPLLVLVYWILRHMLGSFLFMIGATRSTGSLFEHCMQHGLERSALFRYGAAALAAALILYAMVFSDSGPPWPWLDR